MKYFVIILLLVLAFPMVRAKARKLGIVAGEEATPQVLTSAQVLEVSAASKEKVLLVFWQPKCGSCESMEPMIQQVEQANPALQVIRINTRLPENRQIHDEYGVRGTPTFVILQNGRQVGRDNGPFRNKQDFLGFLRTNKSPYQR
jgi:thiol-disulfide isomerase/thioredoxin